MTRAWTHQAVRTAMRDPLAVALWLWLAVAAAAAARTLISPSGHSVFPIFAASAAHWWADQPLYDEHPPLDCFRYSPAFAVAVTPFAALGLSAGGVLWIWLGMAVYHAGLCRYARDVLPDPMTPGRAAAFLVLAALLALRGFWNAQSNALVVGLILLGASGLVRERWWTAASFLALAVWVKLTPMAPALLLCLLWPRRLAPRFAAALALGALVPFLTRPPDIVLNHYVEWVEHLTHSGGGRWPGFRDGWTLWVIVRHLFEGVGGPPPARLPIDAAGYRALQLLSAVAVLAWCRWQQSRGAAPAWLTHSALGLAMGWLMLFGPAVEHATFAFLAPPLAWAALDRDAWRGGHWLIVTALVFIAILGWGAITRPLLDWSPILAASLPLGTAFFTVWWVGYMHACPVRVRLGLPAPVIAHSDRQTVRPVAAAPIRSSSHTQADPLPEPEPHPLEI